jgi:hypothetical protein
VVFGYFHSLFKLFGTKKGAEKSLPTVLLQMFPAGSRALHKSSLSGKHAANPPEPTFKTAPVL